MVIFRGFAHRNLAPWCFFGSEAVPLDLNQPLNLPPLAATAAAAMMLSDLGKLGPLVVILAAKKFWQQKKKKRRRV